jgi:hypothetical protein
MDLCGVICINDRQTKDAPGLPGVEGGRPCQLSPNFAPGTGMTPIKAKLMHLFGWQGKVFDKKKGCLVNKILPLGHHAIRAEVYKDKSWYDGKECIAIDYSKTSLVAKWIRDEIRLIAPRMYLGVVFMGKKKTIDFVLVFPK